MHHFVYGILLLYLKLELTRDSNNTKKYRGTMLVCQLKFDAYVTNKIHTLIVCLLESSHYTYKLIANINTAQFLNVGRVS
jgi:hypothetical protein